MMNKEESNDEIELKEAYYTIIFDPWYIKLSGDFCTLLVQIICTQLFVIPVLFFIIV